MKEKIKITADAERVINMLKSVAPYKDSEALIQELNEMKMDLREKQGKRNITAFFIIVAVIAGMAAYDWYLRWSERTEQQRIKQVRIEAERSRSEAEKKDEKSRIEALRLELQNRK